MATATVVEMQFLIHRPKTHALSVMHAVKVVCMQNKVNESLSAQTERRLTVMDFS